MKLFAAIGAWVANHKKLSVTLLGAAISCIPDTVLDAATKAHIQQVAMAYILGQGIADHGKEAAIVNARAGVGGALPRSEMPTPKPTLFPPPAGP